MIHWLDMEIEWIYRKKTHQQLQNVKYSKHKSPPLQIILTCSTNA